MSILAGLLGGISGAAKAGVENIDKNEKERIAKEAADLAYKRDMAKEAFRANNESKLADKRIAATAEENRLGREHTSSENKLGREHTTNENRLRREHDVTMEGKRSSNNFARSAFEHDLASQRDDKNYERSSVVGKDDILVGTVDGKAVNYYIDPKTQETVILDGPAPILKSDASSQIGRYRTRTTDTGDTVLYDSTTGKDVVFEPAGEDGSGVNHEELAKKRQIDSQQKSLRQAQIDRDVGLPTTEDADGNKRFVPGSDVNGINGRRNVAAAIDALANDKPIDPALLESVVMELPPVLRAKAEKIINESK